MATPCPHTAVLPSACGMMYSSIPASWGSMAQEPRQTPPVWNSTESAWTHHSFATGCFLFLFGLIYLPVMFSELKATKRGEVLLGAP